MKTVRFLIVEDHEFQSLMLERALRAIGAESIHAASNGSLAMRALSNPDAPIDVVITDLVMPDVDGIELIGLLRKSGNRAAVILVSAAEPTLSAAVAIAEGSGISVLGAITKPVTPANLMAVLEPYLASRLGAEANSVQGNDPVGGRP